MMTSWNINLQLLYQCLIHYKSVRTPRPFYFPITKIEFAQGSQNVWQTSCVRPKPENIILDEIIQSGFSGEKTAAVIFESKQLCETLQEGIIRGGAHKVLVWPYTTHSHTDYSCTTLLPLFLFPLSFFPHSLSHVPFPIPSFLPHPTHTPMYRCLAHN